MMERTVFMMAWALNLYGMHCFMIGVPKILKEAADEKRLRKILVPLIEIALILIMKERNVSVLPLMFVQYVYCLCQNWKKSKPRKTALRGLLCISSVIVVELGVGMWYAVRLKHVQTGSQWYDLKVIILSLTLSAMIQYMAILIKEAGKRKDCCNKIVLYLLMLKTAEEMGFWLQLAACSPQGDWFLMKELWFLIVQILNYAVLLLIITGVKRCDKRDKRFQLKLNKYEYYLHMEEEHLMIRRMYHDIKNQLMIMENMSGQESEKQKEYVQNMAKELESMEQYYHTGQTVLDIILFDSNRRAKEKGIEFDAVISENCLNFLDEMDLGVIFTNAINNAIEECEKITDGPKKIQIKAGENLNDVLIYFKNTVNETREKGSLKTRKKNFKMHGIGLSSIQKAVEKYQGYISIREDEAFQLTILFVRGKEMNDEKKLEDDDPDSDYHPE